MSLNDKISSLYVSRGWQITICQHSNFQGWCKTYDRNANLKPPYDNQLSSYKIARKMHNQETSQACFYQDDNYLGKSMCLHRGETFDAKYDLSYNDMISSMKIDPGLTVIVYVDSDFKGDSQRYTQSTPQVGPTWNDKISSIIVQ